MSTIFDGLNKISANQFILRAKELIRNSDNKYIGIINKFMKANNIKIEDFSNIKNPINKDNLEFNDLSNNSEELNSDVYSEEDYAILLSKLKNIRLNMITLENYLFKNH